MTDKRAANLIKARLNKIKTISQDYFDKAELNKTLYQCKINNTGEYEWEYSFFDPYVFPVIRNYLSRSNPDKIRIQLEARKAQEMEKKQVNQDLINWELNELFITETFLRMFFSSYMGSRGYLKTGWEYRPRYVVKNGEREIEYRPLISHASAKFVRFQDILVPNLNNPVISEQPYVLEVIQKNVGEMFKENKIAETANDEPMWDEKWLRKLKKSGVLNKQLEYSIEMPVDEILKDDSVFKSAYVNLISMRTLDNEVYYVPLDGDDAVINTDKNNEFDHGHYPYVSFSPLVEDDAYYPMALVDSFADLQMAQNEIFNQTLTNVRQINNSMWVAGTDAAQTPDWMFESRPNGIIRVVGGVEQIQQIRAQDNTVPALKMMESVQNKIERTSGISSLYASGAPGASINQTARGAQIIDQNIDTNIRLIMDIFSTQVIKPLAEHFMELNAQYVTEEQTFQITNKKGVSELIKVDPDEVSLNFNVYVTSEYMLKQTPASKQASLQNFLTAMTNFANTTNANIDFVPIIDALAQSYPEMENIDRIIVNDDEKLRADIEMMIRGQMPEVKIRDNHKGLLTGIQVFLADSFDQLSEEQIPLFQKYIEQHAKYIQAEKEMNAMSQPQLPQGLPQDALMGQMQGNIQGGMPPEQAGLDPNEVARTYNLGDIA